MEYEQIKHELENSAALKLLRSRNAALILSFLYKQFKVNHCVLIAQSELENKLGDYLEYLRESEPEAYPRLPKEYLKEWCDDQLFMR